MTGVLFRHWEIKLLSLALASIVWFYVVSADRADVALTVPVEYTGLERGMVLVGPTRETVEMQVQAARWASARLAPGALRVRADLSRAREGDNAVQLAPAHAQLPAGVSVTRIAPAFVRVTVAAAVTKSVRVVPQIRGSPAADHALRRVVVEPAMVQVTGPRSTIESRASVETVPVDVSGRRQTVTETVGLVLPDAVQATAERSVQVTVEIRPEESMRRSAGERK